MSGIRVPLMGVDVIDISGPATFRAEEEVAGGGVVTVDFEEPASGAGFRQGEGAGADESLRRAADIGDAGRGDQLGVGGRGEGNVNE